MIPWLIGDAAFPPLELALTEPNGLLCVGGDLSPQRLLEAYRQGIFPWSSVGEPLLWWSPDPRMVIAPGELIISRSLRRTLRAGHFEIRLDEDFQAVILACAGTPRKGQRGTWITREMQRAYTKLFELGHAHCVEVLAGGVLVGGLYGVAIGKMFYGESMFSHASDASKIALAGLCRLLEESAFALIDCQMHTAHLASLGAHEMARSEFIEALRAATAIPVAPGRWPALAADRRWE